MSAPNPDKRTLDEFIKHHKLDESPESQRLYQNYISIQKILEGKRKRYKKKREEFLANTPPEQRPKMGRPRKVREEEQSLNKQIEEQKVQIQEQQTKEQALQKELQALREELETIKKQKEPQPQEKPKPVYTVPASAGLPNYKIVSNTKTPKKL